MRSVTEHNGLEFVARFYDSANAPSIPATAHWRLDCQATGKVLQDWTEVTPVIVQDEFGDVTEARVTVEIDANLNVIQLDGNRHEVKELTVCAALNTPREYSEPLLYDVVNRKRR